MKISKIISNEEFMEALSIKIKYLKQLIDILNDYLGYEGKGVLDNTLDRYNGKCLKGDGNYPKFPFELWLYSGYVVRTEDGLKKVLEENQKEGERRYIARV